MKKSFIPQVLITALAVLLTVSAVYAAAASSNPTVSMKAHDAQGVQCVDCHGTKTPTKAPSIDGCLSCHANSDGTYRGELDKNGIGIEKSYPESRKTKMAAMHDSHVGKLRCTLCHTSHKMPDSKNIYCNNCHQFEVEIK